MELPFTQQDIGESQVLRTFSASLDAEELVWHRDLEDRWVVSEGETDWMVQLDNELPKNLNTPIFIPNGVYHRLIRGTGDLLVRIRMGQSS